MVHHRDLREPGTRPFRRCAGHRQEVCGLRWSTGAGNTGGGGVGAGSGSGESSAGSGGLGPGFGVHTAGAMLASGGNDNKVCIWDLRGSRRSSANPGAIMGVSGSSPAGNTRARSGSISASEDLGDVPLWKFHEHTAAVKALAWDPHVSGVLATGGGTQDKHIRFWNTYNGSMLHELDTGSQVCAVTCLSFLELTSICVGLQSDLVNDIPRTGQHTWVLEHDCSKPDLHLAIPLAFDGCGTHGPHAPRTLPRDESRG